MAIVTSLAPTLRFKSWLNNGEPNAFGTLQSYAAGTTTPIATYTDVTGATTNPNPITLNFRGEASVWLNFNTGYKFVEYDSSGNLINTTDEVYNNQLITLYGGVDTGVANAYVLNFPASFTSLVNGNVVYWVPSNSNTSASTINVNSLGVLNLTNPDGSALTAGQVTNGQPVQMMYYNGAWILLNGSFVPGALTVEGNLTAKAQFLLYAPTLGGTAPVFFDQSAFTATLTGFTTTVTCSVSFRLIGGCVLLTIPTGSGGTSNANTFTLTGIPSNLIPATLGGAIPVAYSAVQDGGTAGQNVSAFLSTGGTITFYKGATGNSWTTSGNKGFVQTTQLLYSLA